MLFVEYCERLTLDNATPRQRALSLTRLQMTLTIGVKRYDGKGERRLLNLLQDHPTLVADLNARFHTPETRARALAKLELWIQGSTTRLIPHFGKGQNKSFASKDDMLVWLCYKTNKTFVDNAVRETELARQIDACPGIRRMVAALTTQAIPKFYNTLDQTAKAKLRDHKGRYARFYSKSFWYDRSILEGVKYFNNQNNPSLSEMAAFLCDLALACRLLHPEVGSRVQYTRGHDELRLNRAEVAKNIADALQQLERKQTAALANISRFELRRVGLLEGNLKRLQQLLQSPVPIPWAELTLPRNDSLLKEFREFEQAQSAVNQGETLYHSREWEQRRRELLREIESGDELRRREATASATAQQHRDALTTAYEVDVEKTRQGTGDSKRLLFNVDPSHQWTRFMMSHNAAIGAGPSSTTAVTLGLVSAVIAATQHAQHFEDKVSFAVAMALFAFWQRKKTLLRGSSAVHTWNEVVTALDLYLPRGSDFLMPRDEDFAADNLGQAVQCTIYEYPDRFTEGGYPVFLNNNQ
jgi:hypothetical protein